MKSLFDKWFWPLVAVAAAVILVGHAAACARIPVPVFSINGFSIRGFTFNDFALLNYTAEAARQFYAHNGTLWGYEPHFMAGYPLGFIWNSNISVQWLSVTLWNMPAGEVVRLYFLGGLLLFPAVLWCSLRVMGLPQREAAAGLAAGALYFMAGLPAMFFYVGMITAGAVASVSVLAAAFMYRYVKDGGPWFVGLAVFAPFALYVHKTAAIMLLLPAAAATVWVVRRGRRVRLAGLLAVAMLVYVANAEWIRAVFFYIAHMQPVPDAPFWRNTDLLLPVKEYMAGYGMMNNLEIGGVRGAVRSASLMLLLIFGIAGAVAWWKRGERGRVLTIAVPAACLWIFSYYGGLVPGMGELNPTRYLSAVNLLLAAAAGTGLAGMVRPGGGTMARRVAAVAAGMMFIGGMVFMYQWFGPFRILLSRPVIPEVEAIVKRITEFPDGGRVMIEDSGDMDAEGTGQVYGGAQILANFGLMTGREFIGGPYPYVFLDYRYASFADAKAFGRPLNEFLPGDLSEMLELYDVKWIICWSGPSKGYFRNFGGFFPPEGEVGPFEIFEVKNYEPDITIKGEAEVDAGYGMIRVSKIVPVDGELVLKYHWPETYLTDPEVEIERYEAGGDPAGFIRAVNPPEEFTIYVP